MTTSLSKVRGKILIQGFVCLFLGSWSFGQTSTQVTAQPVAEQAKAQPISQDQTTLQAFQTEQQALGQSLMALVKQGATPAQMEAWQQQNATRLQAQQEKATAMGAASSLRPMPTITEVEIPADASQTQSDFMVAQATLANAHAAIHNQVVQAIPASSAQSKAGQAQIKQMEQAAMEQFQKEHAGELQAQQQRSQTLADESTRKPLRVPPPLQIPPNAPPQMVIFLRVRDQLMREQIVLHNQWTTATPATREAALSQWMQQNAARFQQAALTQSNQN